MGNCKITFLSALFAQNILFSSLFQRDCGGSLQQSTVLVTLPVSHYLEMAAGDTQGQVPLILCKAFDFHFMFLLDKSSAPSFLLQDLCHPQGLTVHDLPVGSAGEVLTLEYLTLSLLKVMCKNRDYHLSLYPSILAASCFKFKCVILAFIIPSKLLCCCQWKGLLFSSVRMPETSEMPPICDALTTELFFSPFCCTEALHRTGCYCVVSLLV